MTAAEVLGIPEPPGAPYREVKVNGPCEGDTCYRDFTAVPAGKILEVDLISCFATLQDSAFFRGFLVSIKSGAEVAMVPGNLEGSGGSFIYVSGALNSPLFFKAGERMRITVLRTAGPPHCHASGYLYPKQ